jgi:HEAT repeat protein
MSFFQGLFEPNIRKMEARHDVKGLIRALSYKKYCDVPKGAAEALGVIGDSRAVKPLLIAIAAHKDRHTDVCTAAAEALVKIGASAVEPLIAALKDRDSDVRIAAVEALGKIGDTRAVEPLIAALKDRDSHVCIAAVKALGKIGDTRAVEPLIAALKDRDRFVRYAAVEALGKIGDTRAVEPLIAALKDSDSILRKVAAEVLGKIGDPRAVEPLIAALNDSDSGVRKVAAEALGMIGDPRAVEPLIAALNDSDSKVRKVAAEVLGKMGDTRAVEPLIAALKDSDVRKAAVEALDQCKWQPDTDENGAFYWIARGKLDECVAIGLPAVKPLIAELKNSDSKRCKEIAEALVKIGATAVELLILTFEDAVTKFFKEEDKKSEEVIGALAVYTQGVQNFIQTQKERGLTVEELSIEEQFDKKYREEMMEASIRGYKLRVIAFKSEIRVYANALVEFGALAVEPFVSALNDVSNDVREVAIDALVMIGAPAVEPLIAVLKDENKDLRKAAAEILEQLRWKPGKNENGARYWLARNEVGKCAAIGVPAVGPLVAALKDGGKENCEAVVSALVQIGVPAVKPLIAALKNNTWEAREAAAGALGRIVDARAVNPLITALKDNDKDVRKAAAGVLGKIGDARAVDPLIKALKDNDKDVRKVAAGALGQIGDARAVDPLITALKDNTEDVRKVAESALVKIGTPAVLPLIAVLKIGNTTAANLLDRLGWQPDKGEAGAAYWIAKQRWDKCVEIGASAVESLIAALSDQDPSNRMAAAQSLVKIYRSGNLDDNTKQVILARRNIMMQLEHHSDVAKKHQDGRSYGRYHSDKDCFGNHTDDAEHADIVTQPHEDRKYGLDFPL